MARRVIKRLSGFMHAEALPAIADGVWLKLDAVAGAFKLLESTTRIGAVDINVAASFRSRLSRSLYWDASGGGLIY